MGEFRQMCPPFRIINNGLSAQVIEELLKELGCLTNALEIR